MRKLLQIVCLVTLALPAGALSARAGIVSGPRMIDPPAVLGRDPLGTDSFYAFYETQDHVLEQALRVDGGWIGAGTEISSQYVLYDPAQRTHHTMTIVFDAPILGVASGGRRLRRSDWLGVDGVKYKRFRDRGKEARDRYTISDDGYSITFKMRANSPGDYFRILTAARGYTPPPPPIEDDPPDTPALPEPGAALLFGAGALAVRRFARQRSR